MDGVHFFRGAMHFLSGGRYPKENIEITHVSKDTITEEDKKLYEYFPPECWDCIKARGKCKKSKHERNPKTCGEHQSMFYAIMRDAGGK